MACTDQRDGALQAFADEAHRLHVTWTLWRRLFHIRVDDFDSIPAASAAGDEAYRATGAASTLFFVYVRWHMYRGVLLDLCRLCDQPETSGQENLTVERVLEGLPTDRQNPSARLASILCRSLVEFARSDTGLRRLRHKCLAHFDLESALRPYGVPAPDVDAVDVAVRQLVDFVHAARNAVTSAPIQFGEIGLHADRSIEREWNHEVDRLVTTLARGLASKPP